jgi:hypothetical protein
MCRMEVDAYLINKAHVFSCLILISPTTSPTSPHFIWSYDQQILHMSSTTFYLGHNYFKLWWGILYMQACLFLLGHNHWIRPRWLRALESILLVFPSLVSPSCLHSLPSPNNKDCLSTYPFQSMVIMLELPYIASCTPFIANVATFLDKNSSLCYGVTWCANNFVMNILTLFIQVINTPIICVTCFLTSWYIVPSLIFNLIQLTQFEKITTQN